MTEFNTFKTAVQNQLATMALTGLWEVSLNHKDELWDEYLGAFPEGTNPMFRERTEHDCNCCKQFIRDIGNVVTIQDGELISVWDIEVDSFYQEVAEALSATVSKKAISNVYRHYQAQVGSLFNHGHNEDGSVSTYEHFFCQLPSQFVDADAGSFLSQTRSDFEVLVRSLEEISLQAAEVVLELVEQGSLYRGDEHKAIIKKFIETKREFDKVELASDKKLLCWKKASELKGAGRFRNTVIGSLLVDISEGRDLEAAVKAFETKVAPTNYKRPTALITQGMIKKAQDKVGELGIEDSLSRRMATVEDLTINNVIWADRSSKKSMNVFDGLSSSVAVKKPNMDKVEEVSVESFIKDLVPKAESIEVFVENKMKNNLMTLVAPSFPDSPNILKWPNNFSWAYNGDITDSIKEKVKAAGGQVEGVLRASLAWHNSDDLDLSVVEPSGRRIFFGDSSSPTSGKLDVDMNAHTINSEDPVENIIWSREDKMIEGVYTVYVHNYTKRTTVDEGFEVELSCGGFLEVYSHPKGLRSDQKIEVVKFKWSRAGGVEVIKSIGGESRSQEVWGISTSGFVPVKMVLNSPNHWDNNAVGNKHNFFILEGCNNPDSVRGFFNEYLKPELNEHRKVFEVLGSKMKAEPTEQQLSGLGFSSTQRNSALFKINGSFSRVVKVNF